MIIIFKVQSYNMLHSELWLKIPNQPLKRENNILTFVKARESQVCSYFQTRRILSDIGYFSRKLLKCSIQTQTYECENITH